MADPLVAIPARASPVRLEILVLHFRWRAAGAETSNNSGTKLGYLVVQGYGLTETAPIVTLSHPFHNREGTVGKPLAGVELKIADDGEVLVRGENVTNGYFESPGETAAAFEDGWFHTGDVGEIDSEGHLRIRGRKKEMIVTPEGLKVFPEDVEKILNADSGRARSGGDRQGSRTRGAGARRRRECRKRSSATRTSVWKISRRSDRFHLDRAMSCRARNPPASCAAPKSPRPFAKGDRQPRRRNRQASWSALLQKYAPGRAITPETTLDELGLSSLDRVQLMMELEQKRSTDIDEDAFSPRRHGRRSGPSRALRAPKPIEFPTYNRSRFARAIARRLALPYFLLPLARIFAHIRVSGVENLASLRGPVIFASNHQSHFDVPGHSGEPALRACAIAWRRRCPRNFSMRIFIPSRFSLREWFTNTLNYWLSTFFFAAFPIPQRHAGAGQTIRYMGEMVEQGWSILIFPEGDRTRTGEIHPFQPGVGMIAAHLKSRWCRCASWASKEFCTAIGSCRAWAAWRSTSARRCGWRGTITPRSRESSRTRSAPCRDAESLNYSTADMNVCGACISTTFARGFDGGAAVPSSGASTRSATSSEIRFPAHQ